MSRFSILVVLCCASAAVLGAIVPLSDEKRAIIDHDVVTFKFNGGPISCPNMLARTVTRIGGWEPGFEQDVNGNCYAQNGRMVLEVFLDADWTDYLWIDFTDTLWAGVTPTVVLDALADGSLAVTQHREPNYSQASDGGFRWNVCADETKNMWWVRHADLVGIDYFGCMDNACGGDLYTAYGKCAQGVAQVTPRACETGSTLDAGVGGTQMGVYWIENTGGNEWTAGQTFTADCNGVMTDLTVLVSNVNTPGVVRAELLSGDGWGDDMPGEYTTTFSVDAPGTFDVPIDFAVEAGDVFTVRLSVPDTDDTWVGLTLMPNAYPGGDAVRSSDWRIASAPFQDDSDFGWSVRSDMFRTTFAGGEDAWAVCANSKGDGLVVSRQQEALAIDKYGVAQGDWIIVEDLLDHWMTKCHVSEDRTTAITTFTDPAGAHYCHMNVFARDGSGAFQSKRLAVGCVHPQPVHNTYDEQIYVAYSYSTGPMWLSVVNFKGGVIGNHFVRPVAPQDLAAVGGGIARSNANRRTAVCFIGAASDVSCQLFSDPNAERIGGPFQVNSNDTLAVEQSSNDTPPAVLMDGSESGLFIVGWKAASGMHVSVFDVSGAIVYSEVLIGPMGDYFYTSGFVSIRNDGVALIGREDGQNKLTVLNADGSVRGAEKVLSGTSSRGPAVDLFDDGSALVSYESGGDVRWGSFNIPCPL